MRERDCTASFHVNRIEKIFQNQWHSFLRLSDLEIDKNRLDKLVLRLGSQGIQELDLQLELL